MRPENMNKKELDTYTLELIRQVEAEGLLRAPGHLKEEILERSRRVDYQLAVQTRRVSKNLQFFFYSLKVGAAVVTALFLLFMVPRELPRAEVSVPKKPAQSQETSIGDRLNEGLRGINEMFSQITSQYKIRQTED